MKSHLNSELSKAQWSAQWFVLTVGGRQETVSKAETAVGRRGGAAWRGKFSKELAGVLLETTI